MGAVLESVANTVPVSNVGVHVDRVANPPPFPDVVACRSIDGSERRTPIASPGDGGAKALRNDERVLRVACGDYMREVGPPSERVSSGQIRVVTIEERHVIPRPFEGGLIEWTLICGGRSVDLDVVKQVLLIARVKHNKIGAGEADNEQGDAWPQLFHPSRCALGPCVRGSLGWFGVRWAKVV